MASHDPYDRDHHGQARGEPATNAGGQRQPDHHDEDYRRWREEHLRSLDRDYEEWRQERQRSFSSDFDRWRQARRSGRSGSTTGGNFGPATGSGDTHTPSQNRSTEGNPGREPAADRDALGGPAGDTAASATMSGAREGGTGTGRK